MRITPIDTVLAEEGSWFIYHGVPLKIARANNMKFRKLFRQLTKPFAKEIERQTMDDQTSEEILSEAMGATILVGWDETKFPGNIPYSPEAAKQLLFEDPDCRNFVRDTSSEIENYFIKDKEEELRN